ncbi:hypothetical protein BJX62DRAFT_241440 [Aspergillus germanicus]
MPATPSPLTTAGVDFRTPAGFHTQFAEYGNMSMSAAIPASARIVHTTGQLGWSEDGTIPTDDVEKELRQAFVNVEKTLHAAGVDQGWKGVYKVVAFHAGGLDEGRLGIYAALIKEFCGETRVLQTSVSVPELWDGAHIEMMVEAVLA